MGATTDSETSIKYDLENKPGNSNLINIYNSLSGLSIKEIEEKYKDSNYGTFKSDVADLVIATLKPLKEKYQELIDSKEIDKILDEGALKTTEIAKKKYLLLKDRMGLGR